MDSGTHGDSLPGPCVLCGGEDHALVSRHDRHRRPLTSLMCRGCGLVFNWPIPDEATLAAFYSDRYRLEYKGDAAPRSRQIVRNFNRVLDFFSANWPLMAGARTCLDIGAGSGEFLYFARGLGMQARGVEPNRAYAAFCRDRFGLDVTTGFVGGFDYPDGGADLIRLSHVLEHLSDPVGSLRMVRRWLADDGIIHIEVPDIEVYADQKTRGNMFHFGHIFNFSAWTLRACAGLAGLEEAAELRATPAAGTATFFRKGRVWTAAEARNPAAAARVLGRLDRHYARRRVVHSVAKLGRKLNRRAGELRTVLTLGDPARIGAHFVARFRPPAVASGGPAAE